MIFFVSATDNLFMLELVFSFALGAVLTAGAAWLYIRRRALRESRKQKKLLLRTRRAEKLAELGKLTGHLAHEIRNPLSTITMNLKLLSEDIFRLARTPPDVTSPGETEATQNRYQRQLRKIETVSREVERVTRTLNDFLRYAGQIELHPGRHDINEILDDLIDFYEPQASGKGIQIRSSFSKTPAFCRIDKDLIKQAVLNLFINASQAMGQAGELIIRTNVQSDEVLIEIIDTGPGILPEEQEKIFDPYYTTRSGGTGLGLPMCRRIIEEHNGHLELHSEPGKGTRFVIELPVAKE
jgi:signal transduction histidine kinase